jgi:hypothetical protein
VFKKELYNGIPNVTLWRVLQKRLRSKAYEMSIIKGFEYISHFQFPDHWMTAGKHKE